MVDVKSSTIKSIEYDKDKKTLSITFSSGGRYNYEGVPEEKYVSLLGAESKGKYFALNVKGQYKFTK